VLLFQNAPVAEVAAAVRATGAAHVQLHGAESVADVAQLAGACPEVGFIRAWSVSGAADGRQLAQYLQAARDAGVDFTAVILDQPKGAATPAADVFAAVRDEIGELAARVWLAGALTPDNVESRLAAGRFDGVDVARGVEQVPGVKDHAAMAAFVAAARGSQRPQAPDRPEE
jgi:phosphoribosylanthranilate isomerase